MPAQLSNLIALAIPLFFTLMALDLHLGLRRGRRDYRFADALADLGCGVAQQVTQVFAASALVRTLRARFGCAHASCGLSLPD